MSREINELHNKENRITAQKAMLYPWEKLEIPLDIKPGTTVSFIFGVAPAVVSFQELEAALSEIDAYELTLINSDKEQHYLTLFCHKSVEEQALDALKAKGFSRLQFKEFSGTAAQNIARLDAQLDQGAKERSNLAQAIIQYSGQRQLLEQALDALNLESTREGVLNSQIHTKKAVYMEGWLPEEAEQQIAKVMERHGCAYEFVEAEPEEEPPVMLQNTGLVSSFGAITELYGLPGYKTIVDPNPFVAFFFFLFFGFMLSDAAYGIILAAIGVVVLKKMKPEGTLRKFMVVTTCVGISALIWGAIFGSWFGDAISAVSLMATGKAVTVPALMDPLGNPMQILVLSLGLGVVHLFVGMGLSAYRMIKQGHLWDAVFDIGFWYLIIGGLLALLLGFGPGLYIALVGAFGVLLTGGRNKKGFGKITGGLGSLYGITSYLSDILSYSRLMALGLATGVVATVINTMGSLAGNGVVGWILFVLVFIVGQTFNFAINLLGAFVHTCRLQYVEFFGKFFEGGGRPFKPLYNKTKYMHITKEEH